ncbi:hypothetical protein [Indioceanicola profundi]|uniref:hypothetical protein n=1 Tax=Indioceanicola profundi TaxID=2220096 RepID=UPI0013C45012|nr:hypothetical protein [Indioceanicola profundi]
MSTFLREELGVAMSGVKWDVAGYKLWQSTRDDIILFSPAQPRLAKGENGRYQAALTQFRQQTEGTYKITGGSSIFTITSALQFDARKFEEVKQQWIDEMHAVGPAPATRTPRFIPLNVQKGEAQVLINPVSGKHNQAHNDINIGTPGGTNSFLVELTELGAQEWVQCIRGDGAPPAGVKVMYEYLRMMPDVGAEVVVHGERMFRHISAALDVSYDGFWYGGSAKIEAEWEKMTRNGTVEVTFIGQLPPELESIRQQLVSTFADQARTQLFNSLFAPKPDVKPAQAGNTSGVFGGANFAFKYKKAEEITDLKQTIKFTGWTWLKASMDADLTTLFAELDDSYITEVNTQLSFPASIVIDADPMLENVAISWSASEGKGPEAPVFGADGGNAVYTVTSQRPDDVEIRYNAKVNFVPSSWPVIVTAGKGVTAQGGNQVVIKPASWIGRHMIFMFVEENGQIKMVTGDEDYLVCNVSYTGKHLPNPIRASARITAFEPIEFSYPLSPDGALGEAKFSAFGVVGGKLRRSAEQRINFDEEAVFILVNETDIKLVSQSTVFPESEANSLGARLKRAGARAIISGNATTETQQPNHGKPGKTPESGNGLKEIMGTLIGVNYIPGADAELLVDTSYDGVRHIRVRDRDLADRLDDERKRVRIQLDEQSCAASITVVL